MEVNNVGQHGQIIYPRNIRKYFGSIQPVRSKSKNGKITSFRVALKLQISNITKIFHQELMLNLT